MMTNDTILSRTCRQFLTSKVQEMVEQARVDCAVSN